MALGTVEMCVCVRKYGWMFSGILGEVRRVYGRVIYPRQWLWVVE